MHQPYPNRLIPSLDKAPGGPAATHPAGGWERIERRAIDLGLLAVVVAYVISALVGLPLFQDGAWYFFKIATSGEAEVPNLRYTAILPQLPAVWAGEQLADMVLLRHVFSLSYVALPVCSLLCCWLLVRRRAPALILFPLLWYLLNLVNFSGVSELLASLYLTWPLVLAMLLSPTRFWVRVYVAVAALMLAALHPLAFLPAFALALLAAALGWLVPQVRRHWTLLALVLTVSGVFRLLWTITGANSYERGRLEGDAAISYLMTETLGQHLLLGLVLFLGFALTAGMLGSRSLRDRSLVASGMLAWLLPAIMLLLGVEILNGDGIKLKSGLSFVTGLVLMGLASVVALAPRLPGRMARAHPDTALPGRRKIAALVAVSMVALLLIKSTAWWTATRGLQNLLAEAKTDCILMTGNEPFALQWPWMRIIDDWATPMNALAFRPYLARDAQRGIEPMPLLLREDRCTVVRETGKIYPTSWIERNLSVVNARFGPLRSASRHHYAPGGGPGRRLGEESTNEPLYREIESSALPPGEPAGWRTRVSR